jgi:calcineurin-like phosphoesterase family protein
VKVQYKKKFKIAHGHRIQLGISESEVQESDVFTADDMDKTFIISDTHFFHRNKKYKDAIKVYCDRPDDWFNQVINHWKRTVREDDTVIHLGDLTLGNKKETEQLTNILPGDKYLIKGNHDRHGVGWFKDVHFKRIKHFYVNIGEWNIVFSHRPVYIMPEKTINIHGHWHTGSAFMSNVGNWVHVNCCVEQIGYKVLKLTDILQMIRDKYGIRL